MYNFKYIVLENRKLKLSLYVILYFKSIVILIYIYLNVSSFMKFCVYFMSYNPKRRERLLYGVELFWLGEKSIKGVKIIEL